MRKVRNKKFCLVMAVVFALTMVFPFAAFASDTKTLNIPSVNDDQEVQLGTVFFEFTAGQLSNGDSVTISLPSDFQFLQAGEKKDNVMEDSDWDSVGNGVYGEINGNYFKIPDEYQGDENGLKGAAVDVDMLDENEIQVTINGADSDLIDNWDSYIYLYLGNVYVEDGFDGDIDLNIKAPSTSGFESGSITVGRCTGGAVEIEVTDAPTFSNSDVVTIRVEEDVPGALEAEDESLQFILPDGFNWTTVESVKVFWGEVSGYDKDTLATALKNAFDIDEDELNLNLDGFPESNKAIAFEVEVGIEVEDETDAEIGDITARIDGESDVNQTEVFVGKYGQYDVTITADEPTTIVSGMLEQVIADITIEESIEASLVEGRTVTLTLPSNYKWGKIEEDNDSNVGLVFQGFPGKDGQTAKWKVDGESNDAAELVLEEMEVVVEPGTTGDLVIEVGGTAGLSGELTVAKTVEAVTITSAGEAAVLAIGKANQAIGDLTVTENVKGALSEDDDLLLQLPEGFKWANFKDVEVTEGDLDIDVESITTGNNDRDLVIGIDSDSNIASTITVKNLTVTVDRTAPEGDVLVKVKGDAVNEVNNPAEVDDVFNYADEDGYVEISGYDAFDLDDGKIFPETATAAKTVAAIVGTPAPSDQTLTTTIALGDNGSYISDGRIMVQLRDAATALGVAPQNIFWDNKAKAATFIKGERVVQLTVGDPQVKLNGTNLPTDKGAEIKDGRTFVSLSAAGIALNAVAQWDNETKTATLTVK